jgi:hypothetical protein
MTCSISVLSRSGESERAGGLAAQRPSDCGAERLLLVPLPQRLLVAGSRLSIHDRKAAVRNSGRNVQTLHSFSGTHFRTDFIPPDQWSRRQAKTAFLLIHTPHGARLQARLRALMVTLLRSCFDSFSIRSGRARAPARGSGGGWEQAGTGVCIK